MLMLSNGLVENFLQEDQLREGFGMLTKVLGGFLLGDFLSYRLGYTPEV